MNLNLKKYEKAMKDNEILNGVVKIVKMDKTLNTDVLIIDLNGIEVVIPKDEVDGELKLKSLVGFVGREVSFMIKDIDPDKQVLIGSRKDALVSIKKDVIDKLKEGAEYEATVINILNYGAYVEISGGVTGLLKNIDFSDDYSTIKETLKYGSKVKVKLKKLSANDKIIFEAVEKYHNPSIVNLDTLEEGMVISGVIRNIQSWGCYVCVAPKVDAMCPIPANEPIEVGLKVSVVLKKVVKGENEKENKVRGVIARVLAQ